MKIYDAIILHVFPPLAARSKIEADTSSLPVLINVCEECALLARQILLNFLAEEVQMEGLGYWDHNLIFGGKSALSHF